MDYSMAKVPIVSLMDMNMSVTGSMGKSKARGLRLFPTDPFMKVILKKENPKVTAKSLLRMAGLMRALG